MSASADRKRLRRLQHAIDRASARIEACRVRREKQTKLREKAFASEDWISAHGHIEKLKPIFAEEQAAREAYREALKALSAALDEIEHRVPARSRRRRK
jgi:hypothetical protein